MDAGHRVTAANRPGGRTTGQADRRGRPPARARRCLRRRCTRGGRAALVGVDEVKDLLPVLVEKALAEPASGIGEQRVHRPTAHGLIEFVDTLLGSQIRLDRLHTGSQALQVLRGAVNFRLVRDDQQVVAVLGAASREFQANSCRGAGHDGKGTHFTSHLSLRRF